MRPFFSLFAALSPLTIWPRGDIATTVPASELASSRVLLRLAVEGPPLDEVSERSGCSVMDLCSFTPSGAPSGTNATKVASRSSLGDSTSKPVSPWAVVVANSPSIMAKAPVAKAPQTSFSM